MAGTFDSLDAVAIFDEAGVEIARALVNHGSAELRKVCGKQSYELAACLGYEGTETVADRDNITLFADEIRETASSEIGGGSA